MFSLRVSIINFCAVSSFLGGEKCVCKKDKKKRKGGVLSRAKKHVRSLFSSHFFFFLLQFLFKQFSDFFFPFFLRSSSLLSFFSGGSINKVCSSSIWTIKGLLVFVRRKTVRFYKCYQIHHDVKSTSTPLLEKIQFLGEKLALYPRKDRTNDSQPHGRYSFPRRKLSIL